jgi:diguanylate cyclase (GGDEF)-like protein/PAS domain S-box-containing protein
MVEISNQMLRAALDSAPEGIVICESRPPDHPVVYANRTFLLRTGYELEELIGQDLRLLQGTDRNQDGRAQLQAALSRGEAGRVVLRNFRKDGTPFWLELQVRPLEGLVPIEGAAAGPGRYVIGLQREVEERERPSSATAPAGLTSWLREDRLSGLCSRAYFEQLLQRDWQIGLREARSLTLLAFDIDELASYNDTYGRAAGDACIRRVAGVIGASFRRGSDLVARWQGGCIVALVRNSDPATLPEFAAAIARKVMDQRIHHPRAQRHKFVRVSVGVASVTPTAKHSPLNLVHAALRALEQAKQDRRRRVAIAGPAEID